MHIRELQPADLGFAEECAEAGGWLGEDRDEFEGFIHYDPKGCVVAEQGSQKLGLCIATCYGKTGFAAVRTAPDDRVRNVIFRQLLDHSIRYLRSAGTESIILEVQAPMVAPCEQIGFRKVCRSMRFVGTVYGRSHQHVRALRSQDWLKVGELDRHAFGADRMFFLSRRRAFSPVLCKVLEWDGGIAGYVMGRKTGKGIWVGPWVVQQRADCPADLLEAVGAEAEGAPLISGTLESNTGAVEVFRAFGFSELPDPPWHMVLGKSASVGSSSVLYGIGSSING